MSANKRLGVLVSGAGTNLEALLHACEQETFPATVVLVISNRKDAAALDIARTWKVPATAMPLGEYNGLRKDRDRAMITKLHGEGVELVVCAGYDRILSDEFLSAFPDAILNVHPSLLPAFAGGMDAVEQALAHGVKVTGCTVQLLEPGETDGGPIVLQAAVPVQPDDDVESLRARIHAAEWQLLPRAVELWCTGRLRREGRMVRVADETGGAAGGSPRAISEERRGGVPAATGPVSQPVRALIGVSDKTGLVEFARGLQENGIELIATDGTRRYLHEHGVEARSVSDVTGFAEMLDGRVKTLHPAIHAGILARRDNPEHVRQLEEQGFAPIDIVVVNLYPFSDTVARGADHDTVVENIDIGGPTLIRAAAKNAESVAVVVSPSQYTAVLDELREDGDVAASTRQRLAAQAFAHVAAYDTAIADYLRGEQPPEGMPDEFIIGGAKLHELRYGENPHQRGSLYAIPGAPGGLAHARSLQGPELSFTNWLDVDAARRLVSDFDEPAAAVIKHTNPCGFAIADDIATAYQRAYDCDPRAAFGGIVGLNRPLDLATAQALTSTFFEAVVCPAVDDDAARHLATKPRMRVLVVEHPSCAAQLDVRSVDGGLLVQTMDRVSVDRSRMTVASNRQPDDVEWRDLLIAWRVCRHVKSNAVVLVHDGAAIGVGAGQMSRVEAAELAVGRARGRARGAAAASDAFFPMPDGLETLGKAGVRAVIHPGGSKKDEDVTAVADGLGMALVFTGERHFRH